MNFLAHFFLSGDDPALMTGNFLADFISNREVNELPEEIRRGIVLHRQIDQYTDAHEAVRQSIQRLYPRHRKYAPVLVDVYYDYFLIHNWAQFTTEDFAAFPGAGLRGPAPVSACYAAQLAPASFGHGTSRLAEQLRGVRGAGIHLYAHEKSDFHAGAVGGGGGDLEGFSGGDGCGISVVFSGGGRVCGWEVRADGKSLAPRLRRSESYEFSPADRADFRR
nr:hypothetical protein [Haliscomenobacter sp.]